MSDNQEKSRTQPYVTAVPVSTTPIVISNSVPVDVQTTAQLAISNDMIKTYNYRRSVMWFSGIDIFFSTIYCLYQPYFLIPLMIAFTGYYGAKKYNVRLVQCYFLYCVLVNIIGRVAYFFVYYHNLDGQSKQQHAFDFAWIMISTVISIWVCEIIYKFIKYYGKLSEREVLFLKQNAHNTYVHRRFYYI